MWIFLLYFDYKTVEYVILNSKEFKEEAIKKELDSGKPTEKNKDQEIFENWILINPDAAERIIPEWQKKLIELSPEIKKRMNDNILKAMKEYHLREKHFEGGDKKRK